MELFKSPLDDSGVQPHLMHPLTGAPIELVGFRRDGRPIWPIMGAADDDDDSGSSDEDDDEDQDDADSGGDDDDDESKSKSKSKKKDDDDDDDDSDSTVSRAEFDKLKGKLKASDKHNAKLLTQIKSHEDKDKDDLTKTSERVTELESENKDLKSTVSKLKLNNAFLSANTHNWHNPDVAMTVARDQGCLEDLIDDDDEIDAKALKKALDKLAKDNAYLVKKKSSDGDDEDDDKKRPPSGSSGPGRQKETKDKKKRREQLGRRMPALNR